MDISYDLDIEENQVSDFLKDPINKTKINAAINRSLKKVTRWVSTQAAKTLSAKLDVALKGIRDRIYFDIEKTKQGKASIWVGLDDIHAISIGKVRQTKAGVSVRGHAFRGAFVSKDMAWRRASSKHASDHDEVRNSLFEKNQQNPESHNLWPRYPLKKVGLKVEYEGREILEKQERLIGQRFNIILQQELNYEFHVKNQ